MQPLVSILAFTLEAHVNPLHLPFAVGIVYQLVVVAEGPDDVGEGFLTSITGIFLKQMPFLSS